jgi:plastocyanin
MQNKYYKLITKNRGLVSTVFILVFFVLVIAFIPGILGGGTGNKYTVTLTGNGFTPETLKIKKGDTVTFRSTEGKFFWPASDPHPTHTIYPEFDPLNPIAANKTWSFKFNRVGSWGYHDHLEPYYTGTIVVQ